MSVEFGPISIPRSSKIATVDARPILLAVISNCSREILHRAAKSSTGTAPITSRTDSAPST